MRGVGLDAAGGETIIGLTELDRSERATHVKLE
jgi:hypothetical protein